MAVKHGFSEMQEARFPRSDLGAETTGLAYHVVRPGTPATRRWCRASHGTSPS
jgi:hypothetical protein